MKKLPKLYRKVKIRFPSLRTSLGENYGVCFDCDTIVTRGVIRVVIDNGWKWQVHNIYRLYEYDYGAEADQEVLDNIGMEMDDIEILNE